MSWGPLRLAPLGAGATDGVALAQAQQRYLGGNQLPGRWAGQARFVILDTGFGLGHAFLASWAAWQQDAQRCDRLWYLAIAPQAPCREDLVRVHAASAVATQAAALAAAWPPLTPDLHLIELDGGRVRLLLALGEVAAVLPELVAQVDAFYLADFVASRGPALWDSWRLRQLTRLAAKGATLASWNSHSTLRDGLRSAGFVLDPAPTGGPTDTDTDTDTASPAQTAADPLTRGRFAPQFPTTPPPGRQAQPGARRVAVVGAGLAGAALAWALARRGLAVQVFERQPGCARETSGNPGGLFHGIVHGHDGSHARWLRAAALHTERVLRPLLSVSPGGAQALAGQAPHAPLDGAIAGLLRGEQSTEAEAMQALIAKLALPPDYVQVRRQALAGAGPAWFYPGGGWVAPAALCAHWLATPGVSCHYGAVVAQIQPQPQPLGETQTQLQPSPSLPSPSLAQPGSGGWRLLDETGHCLTEVDAVLLCNASEASRLLAQLAPDAVAPWSLQRVRGQTSVLPADTEGLPALPWLLTDGGYALPLADGRLLCGASSHADDEDPTLRGADHVHNLAQLRRLTGWAATVDPASLGGRVGWRLQSDDRLPLLGPVPASALAAPAGDAGPNTGHPPGPAGRRLDQARWLPRQPGLYIFTALGSRGLTQAALGAEVLASWLTGDPVPAPASLLDALDPARFMARAVRRRPPPSAT